MYVPRHFRMPTDQVRVALAHVQLADLITVDPETLSPVVTPIPFVYDPTVGHLGAMQGHLARPNTQWSHMQHPALVVLRGENAYVTPDWYPSYRAGTQTVPTWNYEVVQASGTLVTHTDPDWIENNVRTLAARHDPGYDLDGVDRDSLAGMLRALVGVEVVITSMEGKSKLSQNRSTADIEGVAEGLEGIGREWRANNYLTVGQIYLHGQPAAARAAAPRAHQAAAARPLGHVAGPERSSTPTSTGSSGDRPRDDLPRRPGHGGPALVATSTSRAPTPRSTRTSPTTTEGHARLFRQFSTPGGIPSHVSVTTPGSIHEGGELGYALVHAFGAVFDNPGPDRLASSATARRRPARSRARGRASRSSTPRATARCCRSCTSTATRSPGRRCSDARTDDEVRALRGPRLRGHRGRGRRPARHAHRFAARCSTPAHAEDPQHPGRAARGGDWDGVRPRWPMIVLRSPKGWTGPDVVDGVQIEGTFRAHQVPLSGVRRTRRTSRCSRLAALLPARGAVRRRRAPSELVRSANPAGDLRMGANARTPTAACSPATSSCPTSATTPSTCRPGDRPARVDPQARRADARHLRTTRTGSGCSARTRRTATGSAPCSRSTDRCLAGASRSPTDDHLSPDGRVMEVLSEHNCHGWLEGYTLTGRHGCSRPTRRSRWCRVDDDPARQVAAGGRQPAVARRCPS
jgi:predicted FMN-binding regulatory protein PaiB